MGSTETSGALRRAGLLCPVAGCPASILRRAMSDAEVHTYARDRKVDSVQDST